MKGRLTLAVKAGMSRMIKVKTLMSPGILRGAGTALACMGLVGCVYSNTDVFPSKDGTIELALRGEYKLTHVGASFATDKPEQIPQRFEIFIRGIQYLVVNGGKILYLGRLHRLDDDFSI